MIMDHGLTIRARRGGLAALALVAMIGSGAPARADDELAVDQDQRMVALQVKLTAHDWPYEVTEQGNVRVIARFSEEGRTQAVFMGGEVDMLGTLPIREIWSVVANVKRDKITAAKALELLRANSKVRLATWEISGDNLMLAARISDDIDAAALDAVLTALAGWADDYEKGYSGKRDAF